MISRLKGRQRRSGDDSLSSSYGVIQRPRTSVAARKKSSFRRERLEVLYQRVLEFEFEFGLTDPMLSGLEVVSVEMPDLSVVRVYVSGSPSNEHPIRDALKRARGYLRGVMSREVQIMRTPELKFIFIPSISMEGDSILNNEQTSSDMNIEDSSLYPYPYAEEEEYEMTSTEDMSTKESLKPYPYVNRKEYDTTSSQSSSSPSSFDNLMADMQAEQEAEIERIRKQKKS